MTDKKKFMDWSAYHEVMIKHLGFEKGDTVKVFRKETASLGMPVWVDSMDLMIGKVYKVTDIDGQHIHLENDYWFPWWCLEVVEKKPKITIDEQIKWMEWRIENNCFDTDMETKKEILESLKKLKEKA